MRFLNDTFACGRAFSTLLLLIFSLATTFANDNFPNKDILLDKDNNAYVINFTCNNLTDGGEIAGDEAGFPSPVFDPSLITNVTLPSGGAGNIEYLWIKTNFNPDLPSSQWTPIPGSNAPELDPEPMDITTWYRRCSRREGCVEYVVESNIVEKTVLPCDNVTAGGSIGFDQTGCAPFDPAELINVVSPSGGAGTLEYLWFRSNVNVPFSPTSPNWFEISNSNSETYNPEALTQTTYFIRCARRFECEEYTGETNIITITVDDCCDNVTDGGSIGFDQTGCLPSFDPAELINLVSPSGGTGDLEYLWFMSTVGGPFSPTSPDWTEIANSNTPNYDPEALTETTYFIRCSRRAGCTMYDGETNIIEITLENCCDNVTDGGSIGFDQTGCLPSFDPAELINLVSPSGGTGDLEYLWFMSTVGGPFSPTSPDWTEIANSNTPNYDPGVLTQTTYFIRCSRRAGCTMYDGETNIIEITLEECCDNVTDGGSIGFDQSGCAPFDPAELIDLVSPSGGTGDLEYLWFMSTVGGPFSPTSPDWTEITNSNTPNYDPGVLTQTTYFIRCSRRAGCIMYDGETNIIEITILPSPNLSTTVIGEIQCFGEQTAAIDLTITGNTPPFQINWDNGIGAVEDPQNLGAGIYSVTVTDGNGCSSETSVTITQPNELILNTLSTGTGCQGGTTGSATVVVNGGTPNYTYLWNDANMQTTPTANNLTVGDYSVTVTDSNNCTAVGNVAVVEGTNIALSFDIQNEICDGGNDGQATVNIANGTPPYAVQWDDSAMQTTTTAINLQPGNYNVTVFDSAGCEESGSVTIEAGELVKPVLGSTAPSCFDGNDGTAFVDNIIGGTPDFTYQWNDPNMQTTGIASGLSPGNYSVTVTDANGCTAVENIDVENGSQLIVALSGTNESCPGAADGSAAVSLVTNGVAPFTYLWSDMGQMTSGIENLAPGIYEVSVTDANGCMGVGNIQIMEGTGLDITVFGTNETCANAADGSATVVMIDNGTPPFSYQWDDPNMQTTDTATGLTGGTYQVIVTDATGCSGTAGVILSGGTTLEINISKTDVQCGGDADGTATVTVANGEAPFTYQWNDPNGQMTATATNLGMGDYQVTVTDNDGCSTVGNVTIVAPMELMFTIQSTPVTCPNGTDGTAEVLITNGNVADYNFLWNDANNSTTAVVGGLMAGNYEVTITDANGCMDIGQVTIIGPTPFDNMVMMTGTSCSDSSDGSATITTNGGTPPYMYEWNDPNGTIGNVLSNVPSGNYEVTVTDNLGCTIVENVSIFSPNPLMVTFSTGAESCEGSMDGKIAALVTGGTGGYTYQWNDANNSTTQAIDNLNAGIYSVTIEDANGCQITASGEIILNSTLAIDLSSTDLTCTDSNNGSATVTITGGEPDYSIQWNDDNNSTTATIANLDVGFYFVTVTDAAGCTATGSADIFEPAPIEITITKDDVLCSNDTNGSATANATGGTGVYFYQWNDPASTSVATVENLAIGTYQVSVQDSNGCIGTQQVTIDFTSDLSATVSTENVSCFGGNDGAATATPVGGIAPYTIEWSTLGSGSTINNLPAGTYTATVTDGVGCTAEVSATVTQPDEIMCVAAVSSPIVNFGSANGAATVNSTGGTGNYSYEWNDGQTTQTATGLTAGTYTVTVTDQNGCTCFSAVTLFNPSKIGDLVWEDNNENGVYESNEDGIAGITVNLTGTTSGGIAVNETTITDNNGNYQFDNLEDGQYQVEFELPNNHVYTTQNIGNETIDSDADENTGITEPFQLGVGECNNDIDAGIYELDDKINIGNFVFFDSDRDGIQDPFEAGVAGVIVRLYSVLDNSLVAVQSTNFTGFYLFEDVMPGPYYIEFVPSSLPDTYVFTQQDAGNDDELDSDADTLTGQTDVFEIFIFDPDDYSFDAGVYAKCDNITQGGEITGNEQLCGIGADPSTILNAVDPSGGFGDLEYLWLQSSIPVYNGQGDPNWQMIPNSNTPFYNPGPITQTTYYIRCARRECCEDYPGESNIIVKEIKQVPLANIEPGQNLGCVDEEIDYEATNAGFGAVYSWDFDENANPATAGTRVVQNVSWSAAGVKTVSLTVAKDGCTLTVTRDISIVECAAPNALIGFDDFYIENGDNHFNLNWRMMENLPEGLFYVQHSNDNETFETIGLMPNETAVLVYEFMDENPRRGENFYRIRFEPFVGERMNSNVEMGFLTSEDMRSVSFYPNPFNNRATIELLERQDVPVLIQLTSNYGQVIQTIEIAAGNKTAILEVDDLPNGMYFLQIIQEGRRARVERIFKAER